jgi:hypothetical protein
MGEFGLGRRANAQDCNMDNFKLCGVYTLLRALG